MTISDKTRKILWGRAANRCALCRHVLVVDATDLDDESVIADECHIVSAAQGGPRHDPAVPSDQLDLPSNLILLCRVHHKMVDDQCETYTAGLLQEMKLIHEQWVASLLTGKTETPPTQVVRTQPSPTHLVRLMSGSSLRAVLGDSRAFEFSHDEPETEAEANLLAGFLQEAQDYGDLYGDLNAGERVRFAFDLEHSLQELETAGFWVFGMQDPRCLKVGLLNTPTSSPAAVLRIMRLTSPEIIKVNLGATDALDGGVSSDA